MTTPVIPARMKGLNRAEICDQNFTEFVQAWQGGVTANTIMVVRPSLLFGPSA